MSGYQIGQYRFKGASSCVSTVPSEPLGYRNVVVSGGETTSTSFKDVVITPSNFLVENQDYYLAVKIPQDMNYDMTFSIKLIKQEQGNDVFQFLKTITVNRGGTGNNIYNVVLYETRTIDYIEDVYGDDGSVVEQIPHYKVSAMIPLEYQPNTENQRDAIYLRRVNGQPDEYYLGNGDTTYTRTDDYNDVSISASWREELGDNFGYFELIFRPVESGFSQILIEMTRTAEDYNIQHYDQTTGETTYGRAIDINTMTFELLQLSNIIDSIAADISLSRIGVWSHPELMMAINGEEIKVGPSGYYELDALPITSLGIVAKNYQDNFTIDYQYLISDEENEG